MKNMKAGVLAVSALLAVVASGAASAVVIDSNDCNVNDVTNGGAAADSCDGLFTGQGNEQNDSLDKIQAIYGDSWTLLGKSDEGGSGVTHTEDGFWSAPSLLGVTEFVVALKQGNYWGTWYFSSVDTDGGTWSTSGWAIGQPAGGLSHLSIYSNGTTPVPEPATLGLLGMGLLGLGAAARRKQKKTS